MHPVNLGRFRFMFTQGNNAGLYFNSFFKTMHETVKIVKMF